MSFTAFRIPPDYGAYYRYRATLDPRQNMITLFCAGVATFAFSDESAGSSPARSSSTDSICHKPAGRGICLLGAGFRVLQLPTMDDAAWSSFGAAASCAALAKQAWRKAHSRTSSAFRALDRADRGNVQRTLLFP